MKIFKLGHYDREGEGHLSGVTCPGYVEETTGHPLVVRHHYAEQI